MSIVVHELEVRHGDEVLVQVADLALHPGQPLTIVGESGSGKSLLAHALMGTIDRTLQVRGHATIDGARTDLGAVGGQRSLWGRVMAMLPQEPGQALDPTMRVVHQVGEGLRGSTRGRTSDRVRSEQALDDVGLPGVGSAFPHVLSGGMAQRVAFAAAAIGGAPTLIADEPSKGLDPPRPATRWWRCSFSTPTEAARS
ncbi:ATP-binding cassette domain-containing protein [Nocardioides sp.]|uniref:ATP-binding cassette domain-containing protein n=1 Tax=Nocardioides sp. TaxID=35761 RepID=UPI002B267543|nr:ATP-binding cassette domain-containing protein [Nocardioides sp.]